MSIDLKHFNLDYDIKILRELLGISLEQLAFNLRVDYQTVFRWENNLTSISLEKLETLYSYAHKNKIKFNKIKEQLYIEEYTTKYTKIIYHGSKSYIEGNISLENSKINNDFGKGFYCGESFMQSSMFVSNFKSPSVYIIAFNTSNLVGIRYCVDQEWMLTIAYFRGMLNEYKEHNVIQQLLLKIKNVDYIIAPIADNRMYQIIDEFISGMITDEQCKHALSATNLGYQYVFKSEKSIQQLEIKSQCYLSKNEINEFHQQKDSEKIDSQNKVKIAKITYRGKGKYIDEIFKESIIYG